MIISRIYGALLRHPKFRRVDSVPDFIQDVMDLKRPIVTIRYRVHYTSYELVLDFQVYKSGLGRYYVRVIRVTEIDSYVLGYAFRLSKAELVDLFNKVFAHLVELYPEEYSRFLHYLKAATAGAKLCNTIELYSDDLAREELSVCTT